MPALTTACPQKLEDLEQLECLEKLDHLDRLDHPKAGSGKRTSR